ncbi:hypothetical protein [Methanopyrus sp.]
MVAHRGRLLVETDGELLGSCETSLIVTEEDVVVIPREPIEDVDTSDLVIESVTSRFDSAELEGDEFTPPRSRVVMTPPTAASMIDLGLALKRFEVEGTTVLTIVGPAPVYPFERRILVPGGEMTLRFEPKDPVAAEGSLRAAARAAVERTVGETIGQGKALRLCEVLIELNRTVGHGTLRLVPRDTNLLIVLQPEEDIAEEFKDTIGKSQIGIALTVPELSAVFSGKSVVKHGKEDTVHALDARKTIEFKAEGKGWVLRATPADVVAGSTARVLLRTAAEMIVREGLRPE